MSLEESEVGRGGLALLKRVLIFVIVPAVIAGFFSIAPKLYDELTKPVAHLSYSIISGPALSGEGSFRRIFALTVQNSGKTALTSVEADLKVPDGQIENAVAESTALRPDVSIKQGEVHISIQRMLPTERVTVSTMTVATAAEPALNVSLRSTEALGEIKEPPTGREGALNSNVIGAVLSSLSVAVMATTVLLFFRSRVAGIFTGGKSDIITLIAGLSRVVPLSEELLLREHGLTYARIADAFLMRGLIADAAERGRCVLGLRALLLVRQIADRSVDIIRDNLKELGHEYSDGEFQALREKAEKLSSSELRSQILSLFKASPPNPQRA